MIRDRSILIKNIYYMLSYAFLSLKQEDYTDVSSEEFDNIHNLFAAILSKGISKQLKQGLYKEYINYNDNFSTVKGKIDLYRTIRNYVFRKRILFCEYDLFSENNILNQILKTTAMLLICNNKVEHRYKDELKKEIFFFSNIDTINPNIIRWSDLRFHKNNNAYRMLISLCRFIIEGMLLTTDSGEYKLNSFVDEQRMSRLYEKFIFEYYVKEFPQVEVKSSHIPWVLDDGKGSLLPLMKSDIVLTKGKKILIIDAKYYSKTMQTNYQIKTIHSNNLYQIFTYVKNKYEELKEKNFVISGMILYAATDENIQPNNSYLMSGNKISVRTLNLNENFSVIKKQLDSIVKEHFF